MSFSFVLDMVIVVSLGTILYVIARALPRINDEEQEPELEMPWTLVYLEKADNHVKIITEKFLRRTRVVLMKFDNSVDNRLRALRKNSGKNGNLLIELEEKERTEE